MYKAIRCCVVVAGLAAAAMMFHPVASSASDLPGRAIKRGNDVCSPAHIAAVKKRKSRKIRAALMREIDENCSHVTGGYVKAPVYKAPPPPVVEMRPPYTVRGPWPVYAGCGFRNAGIGGSGFVPYVGGNVGGEWKRVPTGPNRETTLPFGMAGFEVGVCRNLTDRLWVSIDGGYNVSLNQVESDAGWGIHRTARNFDYATIGGNLMYRATDRFSIGPRLTYNWASLDYTTKVGGASLSQTVHGRFLGAGAQVNFALSRSWDIYARYEHKFGESFDTPTPFGKPDTDQFRLGANFKFLIDDKR